MNQKLQYLCVIQPKNSGSTTHKIRGKIDFRDFNIYVGKFSTQVYKKSTKGNLIYRSFKCASIYIYVYSICKFTYKIEISTSAAYM